ncbi:hypothetical protein QNN00_15835 [Bacillus velezensis]|nr:hypothetical protein [Bacillus velezensis]
MKPKDAEIALVALKRRIQPHQIILSVLAGITTSFIQQSLHDRQPVVRVMPNTSSMIGESATVAAFGDHVSYGSAKPRYPFGMPREVYVIKEDQMDIFTGIAGADRRTFII